MQVQLQEQERHDGAALPIRRVLTVLGVVTLLSLLAGYAISSRATPVYESTGSVLVGDFAGSDVSNNEVEAAVKVAATYADIATREPVLGEVAKTLGLDGSWRTLRTRLNTRVPREDPQVIEVIATGSSPEQARRLAEGVLEQLQALGGSRSEEPDFVQSQITVLRRNIEAAQVRATELQQPPDGESPDARDARQRELDVLNEHLAGLQRNYIDLEKMGAPTTNTAVSSLDTADLPAAPARPDVRLNTLLAGVVGFLLAAAALYVFESWGRRWGPLRLSDLRRRTEGHGGAEAVPERLDWARPRTRAPVHMRPTTTDATNARRSST